MPPPELPSTRFGYCPCCKTARKFTFLAMQDAFGEGPAFALWNCTACTATRTLCDKEVGEKIGADVHVQARHGVCLARFGHDGPCRPYWGED